MLHKAVLLVLKDREKKIEQLSLNHYHQNVEVEWHQCQQFFWLNKMGDK